MAEKQWSTFVFFLQCKFNLLHKVNNSSPIKLNSVYSNNQQSTNQTPQCHYDSDFFNQRIAKSISDILAPELIQVKNRVNQIITNDTNKLFLLKAGPAPFYLAGTVSHILSNPSNCNKFLNNYFENNNNFSKLYQMITILDWF